ncbi:MAG: hypothetical protein IKN82_08260 [Treponema sp.]|nr:hypothetical protein [Treponema sp.]
MTAKKYDSFIKNYEEQLSYFKDEYNSCHKKNICNTIITSVFFITSVLLLTFAFKGVLKPLNAFIVLGIGLGAFGLSIGQSLFDDTTELFYSSIKVIQHNYNVQENIIKNNKFKYFINTSKDKDSFIWDIEYSEGFLCKDFMSHNNGTVELTEYYDSQSIWNEENIDLKTHYEEIIDLSDNHILSLEEIKSHSYKDIKEGEK